MGWALGIMVMVLEIGEEKMTKAKESEVFPLHKRVCFRSGFGNAIGKSMNYKLQIAKKHSGHCH
jgi:hypothetical protein